MGHSIAAAGGLGVRQSSTAFEVPGIKQSGTGVPHSKAAAPQAADGPSAFHNRVFKPRVIIMFLSEDWC
jgi:hypothetical protein